MGNELLASKIAIVEEEPRIRQIEGVSTNVLAMLGITEHGPVDESRRVTSFEEWSRIYGGDILDGFAAQAVRGFFQNGGTQLQFRRVVHYTDPATPATKASAQASVQLETASGAPTAGAVLGTATEPFDLDPGDDLDIDVDGGGPVTATFSATAASQTSGNTEPFALADSETLLVDIDGAGAQTITFLTAEFVSIGAATAAEVAAVINAKISGASASVSAGAVVITSDTQGTDSSVEITGGTAAAALAFPGGVASGTGNVANINAVTVAEVKAVVEAAVAGLTVNDVGGAVQIVSNTTGLSSSILVAASSTADDELGLDNATHTGTDGTPTDALQMLGKYDGAYANDIAIRIKAATSGEANEFNLEVVEDGLTVEIFPNVTMDPNSTQYVETVINDDDTGSALVTANDNSVNSFPDNRPADALSATMTGGDDGLTGLADTDFIGDPAGDTGLRGFDQINDISLLAIPDRATAGVQLAMITYAEITRGGSMFCVLDPPASLSATGVITYVETTAALLNLTEFAAIYWPRVKVINPNRTLFGDVDNIVVPPSGHVTGVYARTDASQPGGVYQPPAGVERGILQGVVGFETDEVLDQAKRDLVYPKRINPLTVQPGLPRHIDGTRTLKGNGNFPTVAERRGVIFIEQSLKNGLQFARHSNNTPALRRTVDRTITAFLLIQFNNGAFRGETPQTSFFVDVGDGLNPPTEIFAGRLNTRVGLATNKPVDFVILRFSQDTRALEEELASAGV